MFGSGSEGVFCHPPSTESRIVVLIGHCCFPKVSEMTSNYIVFDYMEDRIFTVKTLSDNFTHVCSSNRNRFYSKKLEWSITTVCHYWEKVLKDSCSISLEVEETVSFCLS